MPAFKKPPVLKNAKGEFRKVGFELEYGNVGVAETVNIIRTLFGGEHKPEHRFSQKVVGTQLGDFNVEIDLRLLTEQSYNQIFDKLGINAREIKLGNDTLEEKIEDALEAIITKFIPYEVATPPVLISELDHFEKLRQALFEHHAEGTDAFPTNAFGTHINIELPDTETRTILKYLQAFLVLYPWLLQAGETDFMRLHLTSFINPFPEDYTKQVLLNSYDPNLEKFIEDYHLFNPDRNRPLDLYPLFAAISKTQVAQLGNIGKINPRETFHYRLPNSWVSKPDWSLAQEWNNWVVIEELAHDAARLIEMREAYLATLNETMFGFESKWAKQTEKWLS